MTDNKISTVYVTFGNTKSDTNTIVNWESYEVECSFFHACDTFSFKVGDDTVTADTRALMQGGTQVSMRVDVGDGHPRIFLLGKIDEVVLSSDAGGTFWNIHGRSIMAEALEAGIDPWSNKYQFAEGMTLGQLLANVFGPLGFTAIFTSDISDRNARTGNSKLHTTYSTSTIPITQVVEQGTTGTLVAQPASQTITVATDNSNTLKLEKLTIKQCKPEHGDSAYGFAERQAKRFHTHIWGSVAQNPGSDPSSGYCFNVGAPDFSQSPIYFFNYYLDGNNTNVLRGIKTIQYKDQPSLIIGRGVTDSGDLNSTTLRCAKISEFYGLDSSGNPTPPVQQALGAYKNLNPMPLTQSLLPYSKYFIAPTQQRTFYHYDHHAATVAELEASVSRRMSEFMKNAFKLTYLVEGHSQVNTDGVETVYAFNTMASVNDEINDVHGNFWVESIRFSKGRPHQGTLTELTLIIPNSITL